MSKPTATQQARYGWYRLKQAWPVLLIGVIWPLAHIPFLLSNSHWALWASAFSAPALVIYAGLYWSGSGGAIYDVGPLRVVCRPGAYVPRAEIHQFILDEWLPRWQKAGSGVDMRFQTQTLLRDATLEIRNKPPTVQGVERLLSALPAEEQHPESLGLAEDVAPDQPGHQSWGQTYPTARHSIVPKSRATDMGVAGHELDLLAADAVRGDKPEKTDVRWLKNKGIK